MSRSELIITSSHVASAFVYFLPTCLFCGGVGKSQNTEKDYLLLGVY